MLTLPLNTSREIFQGEIFLVMLLLWSQHFTGHQEFFLYVRNSLHSSIYLSLSIFIYLSIYFKIVWPQVCFSTCHSRKCHRSKEKGTVTKAKSLFVGGLEILPKKSLHRENSETNYLYINKSLQKICCSCFEALSIAKVFSLTIHDSTLPNRKTIITTEVLSFLSVEKVIHHFHLISFMGLTLRTETNDNRCKLKKKHPCLKSVCHSSIPFSI